MNVWSVVKIIFQSLATLILVGSIGVTVYSIYSPAWQVLTSTEDEKYHEHGLWKDCITDTRKEKDILTRTQRHECFYKFNQPSEEDFEALEKEKGHDHGHIHAHKTTDDNDRGVPYQHLNLRFLRVVFALTISACVVGFVSLLISFCAFCFKPCSVIWTALNLIATGLVAAALIVFFRYSHEEKFRVVIGQTRYPNELGPAFWYAMGGCMGFLGATVFSLIAAVCHFIADRRSEQRQAKIIWPKGVTSSAV